MPVTSRGTWGVHGGPITTFLFTDIEGSTRLWEEQPERMREALACHDALARAAVEGHGGRVVKTTGDGVHAAFDDPLGGVLAALALQRGVDDPATMAGVALRVRCGLHAGVHEARDGDFYGGAVNRAARIMAAAHGGQVLLSHAVAALLSGRLPEHASLRDLGAVRLRDLAGVEHVYQLAHPSLRESFPALRALSSAPNNLPQALTSFVGRERDVAGVRALVERSRLATISGMGGLGKTRLALHVAAQMQEGFADGVWLVELADITDARLVAPSAAGVLGIKEESARSIVDTLAAHVAKRALLLVLDNCEHVVEACAALARRLLASGAGLHLLATSREPLHVPGESVYLLPALEGPDLRAPFTPTVLLQNDATRLFVERAIAARADFELTEANAAHIAAICHRLDGIPLALELAAARVRTLSLEALAERLKDRFRLLRSGDRTAAHRQQTLQALIDWSYELLSGPERALLGQLSTFAGGWTLEAAEAACGQAEEEVVELLAGLVEKSLVMHDTATGRYRMLDTVRQYAQERLEASGAAPGAHARHLAYFCHLAASAEKGLLTDETQRWLAVLDAELENILAALAPGPLAGPKPIRIKLANEMKRYWLNRGRLQLGLQTTLDLLAEEGQIADAERNRAHFAAGQLEYLLGRHRNARAHLEQSLRITRRIDPGSLPAVLQSLGMAAQGEGDVETARRHLEEALRMAEQGGNARRIAGAMNALAQLELTASRLDAAEPLFEKVAHLSRQSGDIETLAIALLNTAMTRVLRGAHADARALLRESAGISEQLGSRRIEKSLLDACAGLAAQLGEAPAAARFYGAAERRARDTGLSREASDEAFLAPLLAKARAQLGDERFEREAATASALDETPMAIQVREWLRGPG